MGETIWVTARSPGKTQSLPLPVYAEGRGATGLRKLRRSPLALAIRLAMIVERAGRK